MEYLRARGRVLDGPLPVRVVRPTPALRPDAKVFEEFAAGSGTAVGLDHHGVRPAAAQPGARPHRGLAGGSHRLGRGAHLRARAPDRRGEDLRARRPALHPGRRGPAAQLRRERLGAVAPGGHQRGRCAVHLHRACRPPTPRGASRWCRCSCSIPCSASSGSATWPGPWATCAAAASWPAAPPGAPPSWARACSTTTGSPPCWRPPTRPPSSTTPRSPTRWP